VHGGALVGHLVLVTADELYPDGQFLVAVAQLSVGQGDREFLVELVHPQVRFVEFHLTHIVTFPHLHEVGSCEVALENALGLRQTCRLHADFHLVLSLCTLLGDDSQEAGFANIGSLEWVFRRLLLFNELRESCLNKPNQLG